MTNSQNTDAQSPSQPNSDNVEVTPNRVPFEVVSSPTEESDNSPMAVEMTVESVPAATEEVDIESSSTAQTADETSNEPPAEVESVPEPQAEIEVVEEVEAKTSAPESVAEPHVETEPQAEAVSAEHLVDDKSDKELIAAVKEEDPVMLFAEMGLSPNVLEAIRTAGYTTPSAIQSETVPHIMEGSDLIGQAETGSGKTAAFAWPILSRLDLSKRKPQCMILAPTRELAIQVTTAFRTYAADMPGFRTTTIYGGQSYETQFRALERGAHVVVGTPGRVIDHLNRGTLDLSDLKFFILDEADEMLRMGFIDDIEQVLARTPRTQQTLFFSATMPAQIRRIADSYLREPVHVKIDSKSATADSIEQTCIFVEPREKIQRLVRFLQTEETEGVLIFVKTRNATNVVSENLTQNGFIATALNGDVAQNQRERTVSQLKSGKINVVVATDVAARGLDVPRISHVINYDFPHDTESYVHRIGRTGRAGRSGNAVLFVEPKEKGKLSRLQRATNQRIDTFKQKSLEEINNIRIGKFKHRITEAVESKQIDFFTSIIQDLANESEMPMEKIAAALAIVAQGDTPLMLEALKSPKSNWKQDREKSGRGPRDTGPMQTYRVEVGRSDGVGPGNLVGAITNEANLTNADIGRIKLFDKFSTIDLPADLPEDMVTHLSGLFVSGQQLQMTKSSEQYGDSRRDSSGGGGRGGYQGGGGRGRDNRSGGGGRDNRSGGASRGGRDGGYRGRPDRGGPRSERSSSSSSYSGGGGRDRGAPRSTSSSTSSSYRGNSGGGDRDRSTDRPRSDRGAPRSTSSSTSSSSYRGNSGGDRDRSADRPRREDQGSRSSSYAGKSDRSPRSDRSSSYQGSGGRDNRGPRSDSGSSYKGGSDRDSRGPRSDRGDRPNRDDRSTRDSVERTPSRHPAEGYSSNKKGSSWHGDSKPRVRKEATGSQGGQSGSRDRSDAKPGRKKTKAALRVQAKRKPGAKLSSPVKKYVKIRSAKKK